MTIVCATMERETTFPYDLRGDGPLMAQGLHEFTLHLPCGDVVGLRAISVEDGAALSSGLAGLSERTIYLRFHTVRKRRFSDDEVRYLTQVDQVHHCAWIVEKDGAGVAVGRYIRHRDLPRHAELALVVADGVQGRGISKALLAALFLSARAAGIDRFTASVLPENLIASAMLTDMGFRMTTDPAGGQRFSHVGTAALHELPPSASADQVRRHAAQITRQLEEASYEG